VAPQRTLKALFHTTGTGEVVVAVIRGDLEASPTKLSNALGGAELRLSSDDELVRAGIVAGYASPLGLRQRIVADDSITMGGNFVAGANRAGYHVRNVNYPRDFAVTLVTDIAIARAGDLCPQCEAPLQLGQGIEAGHLFKLGTRYSEAMGAMFLDRDGQSRPVVMGSYGIGTGRLMQAIIEQNHDERGIVWPASVAPYAVHLVALGVTQPQVQDAGEELYAKLCRTGVDVLYDDRDESAGVKFNDADLIGIPLRITLSRRTLAEQSVEAKGRTEAASRIVPLSQLPGLIAPATSTIETD
jgi:prolyl-tRNA synthetase